MARLSPFRHCEARSAEAIPGSDRPYAELVGLKGISVSGQPLRLLRFPRNDENGAIARPCPCRHREAFPLSSWRGLPFSSLRGLPPFVMARLSPLRHCEARSAEAISGSDRPYAEPVGLKGTSVSGQPLGLLRFARNDENGVIARHEVPKQSRSSTGNTIKIASQIPPLQAWGKTSRRRESELFPLLLRVCPRASRGDS